MAFVLLGLGSILSLVAFVCAILIIVKMFQNNQTGVGVATIIGLFICGFGYILALVYGWQNKVAWKLQTVMPIFTASFVLGLVLFIPGYGMLVASMMKDVQQQIQMQQMQQMNQPQLQPPL